MIPATARHPDVVHAILFCKCHTHRAPFVAGSFYVKIAALASRLVLFLLVSRELLVFVRQRERQFFGDVLPVTVNKFS